MHFLSLHLKIGPPLVDLHDAFASVVDDPHRPSILTVPQAPPESTPCLDTFEPVSFWNVECILNSLSTGKAAGSNGIPPSFLKKMSRTAITRTVVEIVNESLKTGHFPTSYKLAHVCPVPKSGDPTVALNYRPVSPLPVLSKVLERVVHQQVTHFFTNENPAAILKQQFAYRSQHSCEDALVLAINRWQRAVDDDKILRLSSV